ncbi:MAG: ankyrin repeat domain-containing protein [Rhodocyclaceae bacterium]|nr:ankyrin repeat domain-containing protein [Rhodocyclaceae bacterium]
MVRQVEGRERVAGWLRALALSSALAAGLAQAEANPGEAPIHQLARAGSGADIERALAADPMARDLKSALGSTPLHLAAMNPDTSALKALVRAGADPNARNGDGSTPLHMAAYASRPEHAQLLLEAGADPLAKNDGGRDAAAMARKVKSDEAAGIISLWILKGCKAGTPC